MQLLNLLYSTKKYFAIFRTQKKYRNLRKTREEESEREKLKKIGVEHLIETKRGQGYKL